MVCCNSYIMFQGWQQSAGKTGSTLMPWNKAEVRRLASRVRRSLMSRRCWQYQLEMVGRDLSGESGCGQIAPVSALWHSACSVTHSVQWDLHERWPEILLPLFCSKEVNQHKVKSWFRTGTVWWKMIQVNSKALQQHVHQGTHSGGQTCYFMVYGMWPWFILWCSAVYCEGCVRVLYCLC